MIQTYPSLPAVEACLEVKGKACLEILLAEERKAFLVAGFQHQQRRQEEKEACSEVETACSGEEMGRCRVGEKVAYRGLHREEMEEEAYHDHLVFHLRLVHVRGGSDSVWAHRGVEMRMAGESLVAQVALAAVA